MSSLTWVKRDLLFLSSVLHNGHFPGLFCLIHDLRQCSSAVFVNSLTSDEQEEKTSYGKSDRRRLSLQWDRLKIRYLGRYNMILRRSFSKFDVHQEVRIWVMAPVKSLKAAKRLSSRFFQVNFNLASRDLGKVPAFIRIIRCLCPERVSDLFDPYIFITFAHLRIACSQRKTSTRSGSSKGAEASGGKG